MMDGKCCVCEVDTKIERPTSNGYVNLCVVCNDVVHETIERSGEFSLNRVEALATDKICEMKLEYETNKGDPDMEYSVKQNHERIQRNDGRLEALMNTTNRQAVIFNALNERVIALEAPPAPPDATPGAIPQKMDFAEALHHLKQGRFMRREEWGDRSIYSGIHYLNPDGRPMVSVFHKELLQQVGILWQPDPYDLMATDWIVAPFPKDVTP